MKLSLYLTPCTKANSKYTSSKCQNAIYEIHEKKDKGEKLTVKCCPRQSTTAGEANVTRKIILGQNLSPWYVREDHHPNGEATQEWESVRSLCAQISRIHKEHLQQKNNPLN